MNSCVDMLGEGVSIPKARKNGRIHTHSFGASWSLHQFASYSEIHPYIVGLFMLW